jgi:hypothetical protein
MKRVSVFIACLFMVGLFCAQVTLAADVTGVQYRLLTAENVVEVSSFEKSWSFSPDELVVEGQGGMLYYDITACGGNPWDLVFIPVEYPCNVGSRLYVVSRDGGTDSRYIRKFPLCSRSRISGSVVFLLCKLSCFGKLPIKTTFGKTIDSRGAFFPPAPHTT